MLDGPGDLADAGALDAAALTLRDRHLHSVAAALLVVDVSAPKWCVPAIPVAALVLTKCDRLASGEPPPAVPSAFADLPRFTTSARSGAGLESLREFVRAYARPGHAARAMPLLAGCDRALAAVDRAIALGAAGAAPELAAVELAEALTQLEDSRGRGGAEEVLDQIFGRFCLGK